MRKLLRFLDLQEIKEMPRTFVYMSTWVVFFFGLWGFPFGETWWREFLVAGLGTLLLHMWK